jgi:NADH dehydrogenase [ubiquinone] 1 alpha subcomplex assembly factor 5
MLEIFSGQQKWMQKERAAADAETSRSVDYLRDEVASRLCERVLVCMPPQPTSSTDAPRT